MAQVNNAKEVKKIWSRYAYVFWMSYPIVLTVALLWGIFELWSDFDTTEKAVTFSELQLLELVALAGGARQYSAFTASNSQKLSR